jgi:DNA-binding LacI/PurR family transcriptional regulator
MSITKVATLAGVSVATVSRYINNTSYVAEETGSRIQAAMDQIGYVPRALRPGPKRKERRGVRTGNVMLLSVHPFSPVDMYRMPAFPALLGGVQETMEAKGLNLLLAHCPDGKTIPPALAGAKVDGVLVVGRCPALSARLSAVLDRLPVVWMFREHNDPDRRYDHVLYDNQEVGQIAARYLHEQGHQRVGFVSADPTHEAYCQRRDTFGRVGAELGMDVEVYESDKPLQGSEQLPFVEQAVQTMAAAGEQPTALFCAADDRMLTVFHVLRQRYGEGLAGLELIGCNNDPVFMSQMHPQPATIDIHLGLVGREAAELLWQRLGEVGGTTTSVEILIKPKLVRPGPG